MNDYQLRVVKEKAELEVKIEALKIFIEKNPIFNTLSDLEKRLLRVQFDVMFGYARILETRIEFFGEKK